MNKKILLFLLMFVPFCSYAQVLDDNRGLYDKMDRLERDVILMQRRLYKNAKPSDEEGENAPKANTEHLYAKIAESEKIAQESTAQIEEVTFKINQLSEKLEALSKEMSVRFEEMEQKMQECQKPLPAPQTDKTEKKEKTEAPAKTAKEAYQSAYQFLKKGDYSAAEEALKQFLTDYPDDALAGNAQYWLGETYYVQGIYEQAAVSFAEGFKKYKDGPKGPDTLLKLGMTMEKLDKKTEACTAFKNVEKSFPKAPESVRQKAKSEIEKLSCS